MTQYFQDDLTGSTVSHAFERHGEAAQKGTLAVFRKCARDCVPVRAFGSSNWMAAGYEEFDTLYLPLSDDGQTCKMVINAFVFDRNKVMMAREIARANGGRLIPRPAD